MNIRHEIDFGDCRDFDDFLTALGKKFLIVKQGLDSAVFVFPGDEKRRRWFYLYGEIPGQFSVNLDRKKVKINIKVENNVFCTYALFGLVLAFLSQNGFSYFWIFLFVTAELGIGMVCFKIRTSKIFRYICKAAV